MIILVRQLMRALRWQLAPGSLLRERTFARLWLSVLISSFGGQISLLAIPLTAAVLLHATPTQMGFLTTCELLPFILFSLPGGVWLDRVRKLPVYIAGELVMAVAIGSVPLAWYLGWLQMPWLYGVAFLLGCSYTIAGAAAQIVLTQVVARERLVEAHAKNALASSGAEVAGPGVAGLLIKLVGAPVALIVDTCMLITSALILRGVRIVEQRPAFANMNAQRFWADMREGLRFVRHQPLLVTMAGFVGFWQMAWQGAAVAQILLATRTLGLTEQQVGIAFVTLGVGTVLGSVFGDRLSARIGPGPSLIAAFGITALGWAIGALAPHGDFALPVFSLMLLCFGFGAVLLMVNFISLRQALTPEPMLGRMTSTMRWLVLIPGAPGALIAGWIGEHFGLRAALGFSSAIAFTVTLAAMRSLRLRGLRELPKPSFIGTPTTLIDEALL